MLENLGKRRGSIYRKRVRIVLHLALKTLPVSAERNPATHSLSMRRSRRQKIPPRQTARSDLAEIRNERRQKLLLQCVVLDLNADNTCFGSERSLLAKYSKERLSQNENACSSRGYANRRFPCEASHLQPKRSDELRRDLRNTSASAAAYASVALFGQASSHDKSLFF